MGNFRVCISPMLISNFPIAWESAHPKARKVYYKLGESEKLAGGGKVGKISIVEVKTNGSISQRSHGDGNGVYLAV